MGLSEEQKNKLRQEGFSDLDISGYESRKFGISSGQLPSQSQTNTQPTSQSFMTSFGDRLKETGQDISQAWRSSLGTLEKGADKFDRIKSAYQRGEQGLGQSFGQTFGLGAGTAAGVIGNVTTGGIKALLSADQEQKAKKAAATIFTPIVQSEPVQMAISSYKNLQKTDPRLARELEGLFGIASLASELATGGTASKLTTQGFKAGSRGVAATAEAVAPVARFAVKAPLAVGKVAVKAPMAVARTTSKLVKNTAKLANEAVTNPQNFKNTLIKSVSSDVDNYLTGIIKRTPREKFDEAVKIAKEASENPEALTLMEKAGDRMAEATKRLDQQRKSINQQRITLLEKAKYGRTDFVKPTTKIIFDLRKLPKSKIVNDIVVKLKKVKNKLDADKTIDEIQDLLFTSNRDMTIPKGSSIDKQLRGIIGRYNEELKKSLPRSYRTLNAKAANRTKVINSLNTALGEVVDGVSTRGASLIKQFFSPAGRKSKELFEYIEKNTGIDLAQDATMAKFMMEIFDDPRGRALLEGIPTSRGALLNTMIDFGVEKSGIGKGVRESLREGTIQKARDLTR